MFPVFAADHASQRIWALETQHPLRTYLPILQSWQRSTKIYETLKNRIATLRNLDSIATIAVSGSLGRMEFLPHSDVDLIIVTQDSLLDDAPKSQQLSESIWSAIQESGFTTSKPNGIFSQPITSLELCDPATIGKLDEQPAVFGKRIQLLLDSQPLFGEKNFTQLQSKILTHYQLPPEGNDPDQTAYLVNDLLRYQRALAMRYQFQLQNIPALWRFLNAKFRHSRFINHFGLLLLLGEMTTQPVANAQWLRRALTWTPMERIAAVYEKHSDPHIQILMRGYSQFLGWMANPDFRAELETGNVPKENAAFQEIRKNSRLLTQEMNRFLRQRESDWNEDFVDRLTY